LEWQIDALSTKGIRNIALVVGYRGDRLKGYGYPCVENPDWERSNMCVSLLCAGDLLQRATCVVSYSDIVYHPDAVHALCRADGDIVITYDRLWQELWTERFARPLEDAETFRERNGYLVEIGQRASSLDEVEGQYMGLLKFTPAGWRCARRLLDAEPPEVLAHMDMTALLRRLLERGVPVRSVPVQGRWCEVDSAEDLRLYTARLHERRHGAHWSHDWRWQSELVPSQSNAGEQ